MCSGSRSSVDFPHVCRVRPGRDPSPSGPSPGVSHRGAIPSACTASAAWSSASPTRVRSPSPSPAPSANFRRRGRRDLSQRQGRDSAPARRGARRADHPALRCQQARRTGSRVRVHEGLLGHDRLRRAHIAFSPLNELHGRLVDSTSEGFRRRDGRVLPSFIRMARLAEPLMPKGGTLLAMSYYGAGRRSSSTTT